MRWNQDRAWQWHRSRPWALGFNYVPSTAVNTTEFWQTETFDPSTVERELGWAAALGYNACRVFLQYLVHTADPQGHLERVGRFLGAAERFGISTVLTLFDDCAFAGRQPYLGPQDGPVAGVHNSGWTPSPGHARVLDPSALPALERYVREVVGAFAKDERVYAWDLYNEPGNAGMGERSLPLVRAAFSWARAAGPTQPLTAAVWSRDLPRLSAASLELSDVVSFHSYEGLESVSAQVRELEALGRPVVCSEWLRRSPPLAREMSGLSTIETLLPFFEEQGVACFQWGLVNGRTQTHIPWNSAAGTAEPDVWFHDLLHADGRPYRVEEVELLRRRLGDRSGATSVTAPSLGRDGLTRAG